MFSKRLLEIASLVPVHSTVVDVGCDHGLLDIYLTLHRNCKCTASDINENCLKSARENIKKYSLVDKIKVVKSDGLNDVKYNKTDYIIIAGMGTNTILRILENHDVENIIVQTKKTNLGYQYKAILATDTLRIEGKYTGGWGYDKLSTAIAEVLNQYHPLMKLMYEYIDNKMFEEGSLTINNHKVIMYNILD